LRGRPLVDRHLPEQAVPLRTRLEARGADDRVDLGRAMDEDRDLRAEQVGDRVRDPRPVPDPPRIPGIDHAVAAPGTGRRQRHERSHVRVAADDLVENHRVGGLQVRRDRHEVADPVLDLLVPAAASDLAPGRGHVRRRDVHVDRRGGARVEQLEMNRPDAGPDVEHRPALDAAFRNRVDQPLRLRLGAGSAKVLEVAPGIALAELVGRAAATGVATGARPARQARTSWRMNRT
jgi:hypothetical protein